MSHSQVVPKYGSVSYIGWCLEQIRSGFSHAIDVEALCLAVSENRRIPEFLGLDKIGTIGKVRIDSFDGADDEPVRSSQ